MTARTMNLQDMRLDPCSVCKLPHAYHVNPVEKVGRTTCERDLEIGRSPRSAWPSDFFWVKMHVETAIAIAEGVAISEAQMLSTALCPRCGTILNYESPGVAFCPSCDRSIQVREDEEADKDDKEEVSLAIEKEEAANEIYRCDGCRLEYETLESYQEHMEEFPYHRRPEN